MNRVLWGACWAWVCACGTAAEDRRDEPGAEPGCDQPEYGDGECQLELACGAPDIDCFTLFEDQQQAETFFSSFEEALAAEEFRAPRQVVGSDDPRWQELRELLDRGWESYREAFSVADLARLSPSLVLIEDETVNAFVIPDLAQDRSTFLVIAQTGLLSMGASEEELLGLMLHELEHSVGLHLVQDNRERIRKFYLADGGEPIGADLPDDPAAREHGEGWRLLAGDAGPWVDPGLGGLPLPEGVLGNLFVQVVYDRLGEETQACTPSAEMYSAVASEALGLIDPLSVSLAVPAGSDLMDRGLAALEALRLGCLDREGDQFVPLLAAANGVSEEQVRQALSPEILALVEGVHFVDGLWALLQAERAQMRAVQDSLPAATSVDWSGLRYFSFEEAADDATVPVLEGLGMDPAALGSFLTLSLPEGLREDCVSLLQSGAVPYGDDLTDEHHATCWRIAHLQDLAERPALSRTRSRTALPPRPSLALPPSLRPSRLADKLAY
jgi:hypothetical protein